ncbi:MAG: aminodeoxychorismate synthase component I [Desulfosarcina sp.]|nr:aminodeoxychorismate synthase component I [Desulfosarcina sp.]MBC2742525.1 aminodeoxychorismate synthase component I [Desulfosarcina sp.]MBC2765435.1 aminodeoxychorismate synthase component I [Desulfosarcina sp.]
MAARFAHESGTVVLLSGGDLDCARYHILGIRPWLTLTGRLGKTTVVVDGATVVVPQAPLDVLETVLDRCCLTGHDAGAPVTAGLFGYLAYDLKDGLETLPRTAIDDLGLPHLFLVAPSLIVVHDKTSGTTKVHAPVRKGRDAGAASAAIDAFRQALKLPLRASGDFSGTGQSLKSNFTRSDYMTSVQRIRDYIAAGDVYQVNLSQRFEMGFGGDSYSLFTTLYRMNPAPFFAYVDAGDHQIVSTSPERFLLRHGSRVETRPIKGTRPRGKTPEKDREMKDALVRSPKDDAELSMIVDLLRNDIGKVCARGSVVVDQHKRLEAYQNVYHLVSVVEGTLAEGKGTVDLIRAAFPGGSITGCPKIRSMEIIDELENLCRHVYTGSIGYISFHDTMDLSIAIRTATIFGDRLVFSVGGGIVYDSEPEDEYEETLHKGQTLMSVFQGEGERTIPDVSSEPWVWQNGRLTPQDRAVVPVADLGLQYGFGFFETIRVEKGIACRLQVHLDRFNRTWAALFAVPPPDLTWEDIIAQVVEKNGFGGTTAAVKILATRGDGSAFRFNGTLLVTARPYTHRLAALGARGLKLATYPHPRTTPLADHKTLNYLYYHQAGSWAREQGTDEAVILNPDGTISETNTASILVVAGQTVIRPRSPHVLPGVMQDAICRRFNALGFSIKDQSIRPDAVLDADMVLLTNALMGAVPAVSLDNRPLKFDPSLTASLNRGLFNEAEVYDGLR